MITKLLVTATFVVLLALVIDSSENTRWGDHSCGILHKVGLHEPHRRVIVKKHNELRAAIVAGTGDRGQPPAKYMRKMEWDYDLEESAQNLASKCRNQRGGNLNVSSKFGDVGQNLYHRRRPWKEGTTAPWSGIVHEWEREHYKFDPENIAPFKFTEKTQDYTQLAWAESYAVGCGYSHYLPRGDNYYHTLYICHYGPKGNVEGAVMYEVKQPIATTPSDSRVDNRADNSVDNSRDSSKDSSDE